MAVFFQQRLLLTLEHFVIISLFINLFLLAVECFFQLGYSLMEFKLIDLLFKFRVFYCPKLIFMVSLECAHFVFDLMLPLLLFLTNQISGTLNRLEGV